MSDSKPESKPAAPPAPAPVPPAKAPPKNPGMVTFTVDGVEVVAKPGTNMIDAAKQAGAEIPYYCWHPRLSIAANCRMCLVEAPGPRLVPACQTPIAEGLKVTTKSQKVKQSQKDVMEFLLLNHPVDCSICDQAGECKLQDYYMRHDHKPSRLERIGGVEDAPGMKVLRNKRRQLGPMVVLDQERCILCTRCVRFMDEVAKEPQLGVFGRGSHERIDVHPVYGKLDNNYSGNVVDLCPVGALLSTDFRFRARAWFLSAAPSVCTGCSRGCSTWADFMGQDVYRYRPRENEQINKSWMCDKGRLTYKQLNHPRELEAVIGRGADAREASRSEAVKYAALKLKPFEGQVHVAISPVASNEDILGALAVARDVFKVESVYVTGRPTGEGDKLLMTADKNSNRKGLENIAKAFGLELKPFAALAAGLDEGKVKALWMVGGEVPEAADEFAKRLEKAEVVVVQAMNEDSVSQSATAVLPASTHLEDEGSFTNVDGITQRFRRAYPPRGDSQPHWKWALELAKELGASMAYASSRELFKALAPSVPELAQFGWDKLAPMNKAHRGSAILPTAADGRPPGWRDEGVPRMRGI
ncbi:MAG: 2Fe-2S iron-sulfur cluster-binding protein [Myxococcaceae bacterium]